MNENLSTQGATLPLRRSAFSQAVENWLSTHETDLQDMAAALSAGPAPSHFSPDDLHAIMARKVYIHSVHDPKFFAAGDPDLLKAAWIEALTALLAGPRYCLNIHIKAL